MSVAAGAGAQGEEEGGPDCGAAGVPNAKCPTPKEPYIAHTSHKRTTFHPYLPREGSPTLGSLSLRDKFTDRYLPLLVGARRARTRAADPAPEPAAVRTSYCRVYLVAAARARPFAYTRVLNGRRRGGGGRGRRREELEARGAGGGTGAGVRGDLRCVLSQDFPLLTVVCCLQVPAVVQLFKDLQELVVEETAVKGLPEELSACSKLAVLSLTRSQVCSCYPDRYSALSIVSHLNESRPIITHRYVSSFVVTHRYCSLLTVACCSQVASMPAPIPHLIALRQLDLSGNRLSVIPASISRLGQLRALLISDNTLTALPEAVGDLAALATLAVDRNRLTRCRKRALLDAKEPY